jgi:hypothetical protein
MGQPHERFGVNTKNSIRPTAQENVNVTDVTASCSFQQVGMTLLPLRRGLVRLVNVNRRTKVTPPPVG